MRVLRDDTNLSLMTIRLLKLSSALDIHVHVVCCAELKLNSTMHSGLNLFGRHKGWLAGCHLAYDTCRATVTNFNMAAARTMADYTIYLAL